MPVRLLSEIEVAVWILRQRRGSSELQSLVAWSFEKSCFGGQRFVVKWTNLANCGELVNKYILYSNTCLDVYRCGAYPVVMLDIFQC